MLDGAVIRLNILALLISFFLILTDFLKVFGY